MQQYLRETQIGRAPETAQGGGAAWLHALGAGAVLTLVRCGTSSVP